MPSTSRTGSVRTGLALAPAVATLVGVGPGARALAVGGAVTFTALAGVVLCELRRRSGSGVGPGRCRGLSGRVDE